MARFEVAALLPARVASAGAAKVARDSCGAASLVAGFKLRLATAPWGGADGRQNCLLLLDLQMRDFGFDLRLEFV